MGAPVTSVDFHFDIMCPWAFQASVWMRDVRDRLGLEVRWRFFSLEEINRAEGKKHPWQREWSYGWSMMRIGALLRRIDPGLGGWGVPTLVFGGRQALFGPVLIEP